MDSTGNLIQKPEQEVQDPFEILDAFPEICRFILASLTQRDALKCAQVSRSWRKIITAISLQGQDVYAYVTKSCQEILRLNRDLPAPQCCLITALNICISWDHACSCKMVVTEDKAKTLCRNTRKLPLRALNFNVGSCHMADILLRQILVGARATLEALTLTYGPDNVGVDIACSTKKVFPKLKVVTIYPRYDWPPEDLMNIVRYAPNLEAVNGLCCLDDIARAKCRRLDVFTNMYVVPFEFVDETFKSLSKAQPRLCELQIKDSIMRVIPRSWLPPLRRLLHQCSLTMSRLSICGVTFIQMQSSPLVLEALGSLELFLREDLTVLEFRNIFAKLNLHISCPALATLRFTFEDDDCHHKIPSSFSEDAPAYEFVGSVREITTENANCTPSIVNLCASACQMVTSFAFEILRCTDLCTSTDADHFYDIHKIWSEVPTLEQLKICLVQAEISPREYSLDALLCGISAAEAAVIKNDSRSGLLSIPSLQLCPRRPSVAHAKSKDELCLRL